MSIKSVTSDFADKRLATTPLVQNFVQAPCSRRYIHLPRFICNQCRERFSSLTELTRHTLDIHSSFRCIYCNVEFTQRPNLRRHSLKYVGFKAFTYNICSKGYYRKDHLVRHIEVTHPEVNPRLNITTHLRSSECLDFLDKNCSRFFLNGTNKGSGNSLTKSGVKSILVNEGPAQKVTTLLIYQAVE
ncbi:unnamed protein product [Hymenolepis diminuta]|uniref:C2H2-type domain-containing protein n=1 Tax=Hymenolepis diminuta TaxID=6216 RepID=A0A0R3SVH8_HYMDI|nr:unnamed protein product [Hymenolepis diminuta]